MTTITFRSPVVLAVHRKVWRRPPGSVDFRVTQDYDDPDSIDPTRPHGGVDLGNTRCGDSVVAMAPGTQRLRKDGAGALGSIIDHGYGITTEVWHLAQWIGHDGRKVAAGDVIGKVGDTGLGGACHAHVEAKRDGVRFDPEPLIFGGSIVVGDPTPPDPVPVPPEVPVKLPSGLQAIARGKVTGGNLRVTPWTTTGSVPITAPVTVQAFGDNVKGEAYTIDGVRGDEYAWIGYGGKAYYVARPRLVDVKLA